MATYTVTNFNWNSASFWNGISHGGAGHTLDFSNLGPGFTVDYNTATGELQISNGSTTYTVGDRFHSGSSDADLGGWTQFEYFTTVRLPDGSDFYAGSDRSENIDLGGGNDTVFTADGTDTVTGIDGGDFVNLGDGDENVSATGGNNTIMGGEGDDTLTSDAGSDELQGGSGADVINALGGDNRIDGGTGADSITSGAGADLITGGSGRDTIDAGGGNDTIFGDSSDIGVSSGTLSAFDFDTVSETGDAGTGVIGSYAVYDNIGVTDEGVVVQARLTVLDADDPNIQIEFNTNSIYINRDGESDAGTGVTLGFEFFDQATGEPIKITGSFTFQDIDTTSESVTAQSADVVSVGLASAPTTNLNATDTGEELGAQSDGTSSGNADENHWAQFTYADQQQLVFEVTSRGAGTNYAFSTAGFSNPPTVITATPESQDDLIFGGAGDDLIDGMAGNDTIDGGADNDTIDGGAGNDSLSGGDGMDSLNGGLDADTIDGGADDDVIAIDDGFGADLIRGGEAITTGSDYDTLDFSGVSSGVDVTMTGDEAGFATDGSDTLTYSEIEHVVLTDQDDSFFGLFGPAASGVTVEGGAGDDSLVGTEGADSLDGGIDSDTLRGGIGADTLIGGTGNDSLYGNEDGDEIYGGEGSDTIFGETGNDLVDGGIGDDTVEGNEGNDTLIGGEGNDWLRGSYDEDALYGGAGDDYLWGGWGDDTFYIENGFGNDTVDAEGVDETTGDVLDMSAVTDDLTVDLTSGNPEIGTVTDGTDTLSFQDIEMIVLGSGTDTLVLADGSGADSVSGFAAPTDLGGGNYAGNDMLDVSGMRDLGGDPVNVADVTVSDTVGDGTGDAILTFPNGETLTLIGVSSADVSAPAQLVAMGIPPIPSDYVVSGTLNGDLINTAYLDDPEGDRIDNNDNAALTNDDVVMAGAGDDSIDAGAGDDTVYGESGDDEIFLDGKLDNDSIVGGEAGETLGDRINFSAISDDITIVYTGEETGTLTDGVSTTAFEEIERFQMGTGNDSVVGSAGAEHIIGNYGDDTILGGGGNDTIFSGFDDDSVSGGTGNDSLLTSSGADTVEGGAGDDIIDVGAGDGEQDVVVLADGSGDDVISSFEAPTNLGGGAFAGNDLLDVTALTDLDGNPVMTGDVTVTDTAGDGSGHAILTFPNGESITLVGVTISEVQTPAQLNAMGIPLSPGDFIVEGSAVGEVIDTLYAGDPNDDFVDNSDGIGGSQDDTILAYGGDDTVQAGQGDDSVLGGTGDDSLEGESGTDTLDGGDGADVLLGGTDGDLLLGGADADTIVLETGFGADTIAGGETVTTGTDNDTLDASAIPGAVTVTYTGDEAGTITDGTDGAGFTEIETLTLGGGDDSVDGSADSAGIAVFADGGSDSLTGGSGDDTLDGGSGADSLTGGAGADNMIGGDGADTINAGSGDVAEGGDGDDVFNVNAADMSGADLKLAGGETGETGGDTLNITGPAVVTMTGAESGTVEWADGSTLSFSEIENVNYTPCFTPGTMIKTTSGEVDAVAITRGDRVLTRDNGYKRVLWTGTKTLSGADLAAYPDLRPIRILAGALGRGVPERDMLVSPQHRVVMGGATVELLFGEDEVLVAASHLVGRTGITRECPRDGITYVHFMFNAHELVMSDGAWTESFQPGDQSLAGLDTAQRKELLTLFPELSNAPGRDAYTAARASLKADQARILLAA
ncbi:Hint domain-containing protein [Antarctobacter heliothermus]|uniref:Hemolysin-type calcium-binding repeat-containing protein n=1 Tax=Antarctobacter heliothermus TaxID=74033 RepID=A0A239C5N6_9RHOB|nr:Hint domain-containing protein [Antarctobacter heliothermus]SNS14734.1 Hemolysin-type calcium-binding repeat-containing protein [Antarctobacter heliothermus]